MTRLTAIKLTTAGQPSNLRLEINFHVGDEECVGLEANTLMALRKVVGVTGVGECRPSEITRRGYGPNELVKFPPPMYLTVYMLLGNPESIFVAHDSIKKPAFVP